MIYQKRWKLNVKWTWNFLTRYFHFLISDYVVSDRVWVALDDSPGHLGLLDQHRQQPTTGEMKWTNFRALCNFCWVNKYFFRSNMCWAEISSVKNVFQMKSFFSDFIASYNLAKSIPTFGRGKTAQHSLIMNFSSSLFSSRINKVQVVVSVRSSNFSLCKTPLQAHSGSYEQHMKFMSEKNKNLSIFIHFPAMEKIFCLKLIN